MEKDEIICPKCKSEDLTELEDSIDSDDKSGSVCFECNNCEQRFMCLYSVDYGKPILI